MAKNVKVVDRGWKRLKKDLELLPTCRVDVGVQAGDKADDGKDLAYIAAINEFGGEWEVTRSVTHYKKLSKSGTSYLRKGRFVKKSQANYQESFSVSGVLKIPSRPFMRSSFDENADKINEFIQSAFRRVVNGQLHPLQALHLVGQHFTGIIQRKIVKGPWAPNAPSTIRQKGSDRPLIDTGRLRQSIRHIVRRFQ